MKMYRDIDELPSTPIEPVATMGNFDGVHRGHQMILARLKEEAQRLEAPSMVITYFPHPSRVLRPTTPHHSIMTLKERLRCFWDLGIDHVLVLEFDADFSEMTANEFTQEVLWDALRVRAMHVGRNTGFGHGRSGDVRFLASEGRRLGFTVGLVEPIVTQGAMISSSLIRDAILEGELVKAAGYLGRHHRVVSKVIEGDKRGTKLGYPTANLERGGAMLPPNGVYAAWATLESGTRHPAAVNIGVRPTFKEGDKPLVEAHILDFEGDLYGQELTLGLVQKIRAEVKFDGAQALKRQLKRDTAEVNRLLAS